jgi:hypothetical protein
MNANNSTDYYGRLSPATSLGVTVVELILNTVLSTDSMEQSPSWEANVSSSTQEIPRILWNYYTVL